MTSDPEEQVRALSEQALRDSDATGWFERLYALADRGDAVVPWDRGEPHPLLVDWVDAAHPVGDGQTAVVVGCGFGADAELISSCGFETTAFDVSATAVDLARKRHPGSDVHYVTADLFALPTGWERAYDLVIEIMTVQALPRQLRRTATAGVRSLVSDSGTLVLIASALGPGDDPGDGPPWPLTRAEVDDFAQDGLVGIEIEERSAAGIRRWWGRFGRR